jgi:hypothetical protein
MHERPQAAPAAPAPAPAADAPQDSARRVGEAMTAEEGVARLRERREQALAAQQQPQPGEQEELPAGEGDEAGELPEEAEGGEEEEQGRDGEPRYTVTVDGQAVEVPLSELRAGYQRSADYTRKTQELGQQRQQFDQQRAQLQQMQATVAQVLEQVRPQLEQQLGQEPDWERLADEDPIGYIRQRAKWDRVAKAREAQAQLARQAQEQQEQQVQEHLRREASRLAERIPGWRDDGQRQRLQADIRGYAQELGFSDAELAHAYDSRIVEAVYKAMLYDRGSKARLPSAQPGQRPPLTNGAAAPSAVRRAAQTFGAEPTVDNAVALLRAKRRRNRPV